MVASYRLRSFQVGRLSRVSRGQREWKTRSVQTHRPKSRQRKRCRWCPRLRWNVQTSHNDTRAERLLSYLSRRATCRVESQTVLSSDSSCEQTHRDSLNPSTAAGTASVLGALGPEAPTWLGETLCDITKCQRIRAVRFEWMLNVWLR